MKFLRRLILTAGLLAALVAAETVVCGGVASCSFSPAEAGLEKAAAAATEGAPVCPDVPAPTATIPTASSTTPADR